MTAEAVDPVRTSTVRTSTVRTSTVRTSTVRTGTVRSADGTLLRTWATGGPDDPRPLVLLSNGLGSVPEAWPGLLDPACPYRVVSWYHRGTLGSARPVDPVRVTVDDHVADALAVLDQAVLDQAVAGTGTDDALVVAWSIGVNVAAELLAQHPERVRGLLAVAGVPGGTFATMGAPLRVPRPLRHRLAVTVTRAARLTGPLLTRVAASAPVDARLAALLRWSGAMDSAADPAQLVVLLQAFLRQDWGWYMHLAETASRHPRVDLSRTDRPVVLVAGSGDVLTSARDVARAAREVPGAVLVELPGSHFLPLEQPARLLDELDALARRTGVRAGAEP